MKRQLEVINKPLTYATRRMIPGDTFLAKASDANVLTRIKRAAFADPIAAPPKSLTDRVKKSSGKAKASQPEDQEPSPPEPTPTPAPTPEPAPAPQPDPAPPSDEEKAKEELQALRAEYEEKLGKKPFNGWDADTLREKIAIG